MLPYFITFFRHCIDRLAYFVGLSTSHRQDHHHRQQFTIPKVTYVADRDVAREVQWVPVHPRSSAPPPPSPRTSGSPTWSYHSEFSWDTNETFCSQMCLLKRQGPQPIRTIPDGALWGRLGPRINSKRSPLGLLYGGGPWPDAPVSKKSSYVYGCGCAICLDGVTMRP